MTNKYVTLCFALFASTVIAAQWARAAEAGPDETDIRQSAKAFTDAFDKGDADAVAALWTPDGDYTVGRDAVAGREAVAKIYKDFFAANPGSKIEIKIKSVKMLAPTVAIEHGTAAVAGSPNWPPTASDYTAIHVKQGDGKWLMASVSESESPTLVRQDLEELAWLVGDWSAEGDVAKVEMKYEWIANKNFLRGETIVRPNDKSGDKIGGTQIVGRDPATGQLVSWFFNADGSHGFGAWAKDGAHWVIQSQGTTIEGAPTFASNSIYHADDNVLSWQSINRSVANQPLPNTKEIVFERMANRAQPKK
jgi:uncharacterized protein (TIGR02246 family)